MPAIRYRTDGVPGWGTAAFTPVPIPTPLASTGGEQVRKLQQWAPSPDPALEDMSAAPHGDANVQGSYANVQPGPTQVRGLPGAFMPVRNETHAMTYWATAQGSSGKQTMGPNGTNTHMKIWSDNPLPVPARNPGRVSRPAFRAQPAGTVIATAWPRPFLQWPTWGQSRSM